MNAPEALRAQLRRIRAGSVLVGTVTDPYQPLARRLKLTRGCLEVLAAPGLRLEVSVLTRSPLCVRDVDLFRLLGDRVSVGLSITTDDDAVRKRFEPHAPPIGARVEALRALRAAGVATYAFAGPLLPMDPGRFVALLGDAAEQVLVDRLNYSGKVVAIYRRAKLERFLEDAWFERTAAELKRGFEARGVAVDVLF